MSTTGPRLISELLLKVSTETRGAHLPGGACSVLPRSSPALGAGMLTSPYQCCSLPHVTCRGNQGAPRLPRVD